MDPSAFTKSQLGTPALDLEKQSLIPRFLSSLSMIEICLHLMAYLCSSCFPQAVGMPVYLDSAQCTECPSSPAPPWLQCLGISIRLVPIALAMASLPQHNYVTGFQLRSTVRSNRPAAARDGLAFHYVNDVN